jgi:hypothetical protein
MFQLEILERRRRIFSAADDIFPSDTALATGDMAGYCSIPFATGAFRFCAAVFCVYGTSAEISLLLSSADIDFGGRDRELQIDLPV